MPNKKRATLADVAKLAGLSPTAVSLILNGKENSRLSEAATQKAKSAAEALGYRPNMSARSLRTEVTQTVGLISDFVATTRYASGLIKGAIEAAETKEHLLLVSETGGDPAREAESIAAMLDRQVDGLIFASMRAREVAMPRIPANTPVVMLNSTSSVYKRSVLPDEYEGGRKASRILLDAGHRNKIVLLGTNEEVVKDSFRSVTMNKRIDGINFEMSTAKADFLAKVELDLWEPDEGYQATKNVLKKYPKVTALLCMNDRIAFGAYQAILEAGLSIPKDISIVSFDNDELAVYLRPGLTTVALPHEQMGKLAVELLLNPTEPATSLVSMPALTRGSVATPRHK
jgi:LacI family transcriptional regulator